MFRIRGKTVTAGGIFSSLMNDYDGVDLRKSSQEFYKKRLMETETGADRLYLMFSIDELGNFSPEISSTLQGGFFAGFVGMTLGGYSKGKEAYVNFMERNTATQFATPFEAKKTLQDKVLINFARGAATWGMRLWLFTSTFLLASNAIASYRGKSGVLEYTAGGALAGSIYKVSLGPRGMFAGGVAGAVLGTIGGTMTFLMLKLTGYSSEDVRYWQYYWQTDRNKQILAVYKANPLEKPPPLVVYHEKMHGEATPGEQLAKIPVDKVNENESSGVIIVKSEGKSEK